MDQERPKKGIRSLVAIMGIFIICLASATEKTLKINLSHASTIEVVKQFQHSFGYIATNPNASCLRRTVVFESQKAWTRDEAEQLIKKVMANACCDVSFDGNEYTLLPVNQPNEECLRPAPW